MDSCIYRAPWANPVACQRQSQLQLWPIATTIALCKHPVKGLTKPPAASVLRLSSRTLSCFYMSRRYVILLCVSYLQRVPVFSKCSFLWHSAYFHSALYPSFCWKNFALNFLQITRSQLSAFRKIPLPVVGLCRRQFSRLSRRLAKGHITACRSAGG